MRSEVKSSMMQDSIIGSLFVANMANRQKVIGFGACYCSRVYSNQSDTELLLSWFPLTIYRGNIINGSQARTITRLLNDLL